MSAAAVAPAPHEPVLLEEVVAGLAVQPGATIVDGTFGAGGYTKALLGAGAGRVIAFDRDPTAIEEGRSPIVLTERKDHLDFIADQLRNFVRHVVVLRGGVTAKDRRDLTAQIAAISGVASCELKSITTSPSLSSSSFPRIDLFISNPLNSYPRKNK